MAEGFDPGRHITRLQGKDYLEVKWRLVWLRDREPDARVITEPHLISDQVAIFRCHVTLPSGAEATGYGSETPGDFRDYVEKAETKAIGRALAALGFGTQFAPDHDFGEDTGRVVDSPVAANTGSPPSGQAKRLTRDQYTTIAALMPQAFDEKDEAGVWLLDRVGTDNFKAMDYVDGQDVIKGLNERITERQKQPPKGFSADEWQAVLKETAEVPVP